MDQTSPNPDQPAVPLESAPLWKRALDITCVVLAAPLLLPVGLALGALVKIVSPGPAFFKQERIGLGGKPFLCLKFRTMVVNAETKSHQAHLAQLMASGKPMTKLDSSRDPRMIPFAPLIRSAGLDELPQIINVLRGDMSLVGPRPCVRYEYENFEKRHHKRFETLPGLTGLWQVSGKNRTTFEEMMQLDARYVREKTLWLDIKILFKTIPAIVVQVSDMKRRPPAGPAKKP